ncbi:hypothetical protein M2168_004386 [Streptomyces sp. CZ24]|nr:hypothetical protein [Streptomyces sp. CZ24]MDH6191354.1 hypothetical protein [Streptomyces sp. CZ24]
MYVAVLIVQLLLPLRRLRHAGFVIHLAVCTATAWYVCRLRRLATDGH